MPFQPFLIDETRIEQGGTVYAGILSCRSCLGLILRDDLQAEVWWVMLDDWPTVRGARRRANVADGGRAGVHDPPDQPAPSRRQRSPGSPEGDGCAVYIVVPVSWRAGNGGECLIFGISDVTQGPVTRIELPFRPGWTARSPGGLPLLSPGCESGGGRALRVIPPGLGEGRRSRWVSAGSAARSAP